MRFKNLLICLMLSIGFVCFGINESESVIQCNDSLHHLDQTTLEEIIVIDENDLILSETIFYISHIVAQDLLSEDDNYSGSQEEFDAIVDELIIRLEGVEESQAKIAIINNYIFKELDFSYDHSRLHNSSLDTLLMGRVLKRRKGNCLSLSLIYLCIAERLGISYYGVAVPGHFFVRYRDRENKINIETTKWGESLSDRYYQRYMKGFDDQFLMRTLSKKETLAFFLCDIANQYKLRGKHEQAIDIFEVVLKIIPDYAGAYTNLGNVYERKGDLSEAMNCYKKALEINPVTAEAYYNIGLIYFLYAKKFSLAKKYGMIARQLGCQMHPIFKKFLQQIK